MATITELSGAKIDPERPLDGVNLIPYLLGEKEGKPHEYLFWRKWEQNAMAVRHKDKKLVAPKQWEKQGCNLFTLSDDLGESRNIISEDINSSKTLTKLWINWNKQLKDLSLIHI